MRRASCIAVVVFAAGCNSILGVGGFSTAGDGGSVEMEGDGPPADAHACFGTLASVCLSALPTQPVTVSGTLDTGASAMCQVVPQPTGPSLCVIAGTTVTANALSVTGTQPLVLLAIDTIDVLGTVDGSSGVTNGPGANATECTTPNPGTNGGQGGGGGAGGSFGGPGGAGGNGELGVPGGAAAATQAAAFVRAGCGGGDGGDGSLSTSGGTGGMSGGALYLIAGTSITVAANANVFASGGHGGGGDVKGGIRGAGGGGGSGGLVAFEAPTIQVDGIVAANGGGGGGGADTGLGHDGTNGSTTNFSQPAIGGAFEGLNKGAFGGNGAAGSTAATPGSIANNGGGGGGGGGAGVVWVKGQFTGTKVSPAPTVN